MPTAAILPQAPISTTPTSQTQEQAFSTSSAAPAIAAAAATGWLLAKRLRTEPEPFEAEFNDDELEGGEFEDLAGGVIFADFELGSSFPDLEPLVLPPLEDLDEAEDAMDDVLDGPRPKKKETAS
ncbi:hypothetical protein QJQ45_011177 [Haematococcus lacustris]|nr:hypothetical protein QJQ45_011178 [Haematococcus lacustris]KAJ9516472.1 hypothetical protein QJQ45_011177 [Haematococcus lacustris]